MTIDTKLQKELVRKMAELVLDDYGTHAVIEVKHARETTLVALIDPSERNSKPIFYEVKLVEVKKDDDKT